MWRNLEFCHQCFFFAMDWMVAKDHPCWKELEKRCTQYTAIGLCQNEVTTRKRCFQVKMPSARADGTPTRGNKDNCQTGAILTLACWPLAQNQPLRLAALAMATITQLEDHTAGVPMHRWGSFFRWLSTQQSTRTSQ